MATKIEGILRACSMLGFSVGPVFPEIKEFNGCLTLTRLLFYTNVVRFGKSKAAEYGCANQDCAQSHKGKSEASCLIEGATNSGSHNHAYN